MGGGYGACAYQLTSIKLCPHNIIYIKVQVCLKFDSVGDIDINDLNKGQKYKYHILSQLLSLNICSWIMGPYLFCLHTDLHRAACKSGFAWWLGINWHNCSSSNVSWSCRQPGHQRGADSRPNPSRVNPSCRKINFFLAAVQEPSSLLPFSSVSFSTLCNIKQYYT